MAKHSKYDNIKHRKAAQDAKKGKIYSLHAKLITLAAQSNGDPDQNPHLAMCIEKAKKAGVPNENIERAIKKWTWEDKSWEQIMEICYEWYSHWWVAIIVHTLTDNKNRTASNIRHIFHKYGWTLWEQWAVSWMFKKKWIIIINKEKYDYDSIEELVFETDAEDIQWEANIIKVITSPDSLAEVSKSLKDKNIELEFSEIEYIAENNTELNDFDKTLKFKKMIEAFYEDEDVENISSNETIDESLEKEVEDFIEKNTFRT